jgi:periplasmic protein TonB
MRRRGRLCRHVLPGMVGLSLVLHLGLLRAIARTEKAPRRIETIEMTVSRAETPAPAARPETPPPAKSTVPTARPVRKLAMRAPEAAARPAATPAAPTAPAPAAAPRALRIGISLDSTATTGGFAVGVGESLQGKPSPVAPPPAPAEAAPAAPRGPRFVPATRLATEPRLLERPKVAYPPEARQAGLEGDVVLQLSIDERGQVVAVKVLSGPGMGLEEAAKRAARAFHFSPATADGEPVRTEIRFTYTFLLE